MGETETISGRLFTLIITATLCSSFLHRLRASGFTTFFACFTSLSERWQQNFCKNIMGNTVFEKRLRHQLKILQGVIYSCETKVLDK